jgi:Protein of unknown function (DUF2778)
VWIYVQNSGSLYAQRNGVSIRSATGYSGHGDGCNNPDFEAIAEVGPIPAGFYTIGAPIDTTTHGPYVLPLTPEPSNNMFGRSEFLIHGDSVKTIGLRLASHGCIILPRPVRETIWTSGDHFLKVISTYPDPSAV